MLRRRSHSYAADVFTRNLEDERSQGQQFLDPEKVAHVEADSNYWMFFRKDSRRIAAYQTLKEVEENLEASRFDFGALELPVIEGLF